MSERLPSTENKLPGLEVLRFLAALAVLFWHYQHFAYVADRPVDLVKSDLPLYRLLQPFYESGQYGVWVFWCVSGFIFFWKYRDAISERSTSGWTFFVFRLSRLYPLHFVTLIAVAILQAVYFGWNGFFFVYQDNDVRHFLLQIFMASDWGFEHGKSFDGPIWSISVEVLVYFMFFLMLRFLSRSAWLNVVVILVCLNVSGQIFVCLAFFYAGGLAAILRRAIAGTTAGVAVEYLGWLVLATASASLVILRSEMQIIDWIFFLTYTPLLLFCISGEVTLPAPVQAGIEAAGNMTYSSYLLHFPIQLLIALGFAMFATPIPLYDGWFFAVFVTVTALASYFTYRYFERPAQIFVRRYLLSRTRTLAPSAAGLLGGGARPEPGVH